MQSLRYLIIGGTLIISSASAMILRPTVRLADASAGLSLAQLVPERFGAWQIDKSIVPLQVSPDVQANLDRIYDQILSRTYVNDSGERIMLSIAYGGRQTRTTQVHKPEVCYPAQGFTIKALAKEVVDTLYGHIPVMRLVATQGQRVEPITYWIMVGDKPVRGALEQNWARIKYGLTGTIPDGMLIRVSTISGDSEGAYRLEGKFVDDLLQAVPQASRLRLAGPLS